MLAELIASDAAVTRGFVLDLDFTGRKHCPQTWMERILQHEILKGQNFTHICELMMDDKEVQRRSQGLR